MSGGGLLVVGRGSRDIAATGLGCDGSLYTACSKRENDGPSTLWNMALT